MKNSRRISSLTSCKYKQGLFSWFVCLELAFIACPSPAQVFAFGLGSYRPQAASRPSHQNSTPHPAIARIIVSEKDGISKGSGTLINKQGKYGLVVTNWHVVRDATGEINVLFPDGSHSPARVLKVDQNWDLAALLIWSTQSIQPVPLSPTAPQPGDLLTIAGYGSGVYRTATGRCTQYVSPGKRYPYEIVELSVQARDGDSGGPIFNQQGQLAGVLFGSSRGSTSGSYAGRVRTFLNSVYLPALSPRQDYPQNPSPDTIALAEVAVSDDSRHYDSVPENQALPISSTGNDSLTEETGYYTTRHTPLPILPEEAESTKQSISLQNLLGDSRFEQAKSLLAVIGVLALLVQVTKILSA